MIFFISVIAAPLVAAAENTYEFDEKYCGETGGSFTRPQSEAVSELDKDDMCKCPSAHVKIKVGIRESNEYKVNICVNYANQLEHRKRECEKSGGEYTPEATIEDMFDYFRKAGDVCKCPDYSRAWLSSSTTAYQYVASCVIDEGKTLVLVTPEMHKEKMKEAEGGAGASADSADSKEKKGGVKPVAPAASAGSEKKKEKTDSVAKAGVDPAAKAEAEREFRQNIDKLIDEFNKQAVKLNGG